jgi:Peptidase of plants and bacteria
MHRCRCFPCTVIVLSLTLATSAGQAAKTADPPVAATIETTLATAAKQIRMFAFDGDPKTYFSSAKNACCGDHFTLIFDNPAAVETIVVTTGRPQGGDKLDKGKLLVSEDGKMFEPLGDFAEGVAKVKGEGRKIRAVRIQVSEEMEHPLAIAEIKIESQPAVAVFKYPVEFIVDVSDAPDMNEWAEKVAKVCERAYQWINDDLRSDGFKPPTVVTMALKNNYNGVAAAGGNRITGSVKYFKTRPNDIGAMVHETVHIAQQYRVKGNPGWLVEGIADYLRFFKYEPGKIGKLKADPHYNGSYRTTAAFLAFVTEKYDKELVRKLNKRMREGEYREEVWKELTSKTVKELDEEWRASLKVEPPAKKTALTELSESFQVAL